MTPQVTVEIFALDILPFAGTAAFIVLAAVGFKLWNAAPDRPRAALAAALGTMAASAVSWQIDILTSFGSPAIGLTSTILFVLSGPSLLLFRHTLVPMSRRTGRTVLAGTVGCIVLALVLRVPTDPSLPVTGGMLVLWVVGLSAWGLCLGEPALRFWRVGRHRPAMQRIRLRALSVAFAAVLVTQIVLAAAGPSGAIALPAVLQTLQFAALVALIVAFAPPPWLRRVWRQAEQRALIEAVPVFASRDSAAVAGSTVEWAVRLVGADAGYIRSTDGRVLSSRGIHASSVPELDELLGDREGLVRIREGRTVRTAIVIVLRPYGLAAGRLVVLSGPLTPPFGPDELAFLPHFVAGAASAMGRARLDEIREGFLRSVPGEIGVHLRAIRGAALTLDRTWADGDNASVKGEPAVAVVAHGAEALEGLLLEILDRSRFTGL